MHDVDGFIHEGNDLAMGKRSIALGLIFKCLRRSTNDELGTV
jgi:hypothetical protein